jgi:hypothetical protein
MHQRRMGRFKGGVIVPETPEAFAEGELVEIVPSEALSPEVEAEIIAGLTEADRGETTDAFEFLKLLRSGSSGGRSKKRTH